MGLGDTLRLVRAVDDLTAKNQTRPGLRSPWATGQLSAVVWADFFGTEHIPVTRAEAMALPPVARARHLLVGTISALPMKALRAEAELKKQPAWLYRTSGSTSPQHRLAWTVDDLIFTGWSLWLRENDDSGAIVDATRVPVELWEFGPDHEVLVDGEEVNSENVILIPGLHEGIVSFGGRTIRGARAVEEAWAERAKNPIPATELHLTEPDVMSKEDMDDMVGDFTDTLSSGTSAVVATPYGVDMRVHGTAIADLLIQGRNASAIDLARLIGLPASAIDASNVNASLTYETVQGRSLEFKDYSVALYTGPIAARLSLDDVTPKGTRVAFDMTDLIAPTPSPTGPNLED